MNRKFLEEIWEDGYTCGFQHGHEGEKRFDFQLPYLDQAQEIVGFIQEMDLRSVAKMTSPLTEEDAAWLLSKYPKDVIMEVLCAMENYRGLVKKYKSAKLTCNQWCKRRMKDSSNSNNTNIPVV